MENELKQYEQFLNEWNNLSDVEQLCCVENAVCESIARRAERQTKQQNLLTAGNLTVGCQIAEADGFLFDVVEVVKETAKTITVRLASDFSSMPNHWACNGGVLKTFRKSTLLYGVVA